MIGKTNMMGMVKNIVPMLSMAGLDINDILKKSLTFLPEFFLEKTKEFQEKNPDLKVVIMLATEENTQGVKEIFLIPLGLDGLEIKAQDKAINLNDFLGDINIEEVIANSGNLDDESPEETTDKETE